MGEGNAGINERGEAVQEMKRVGLDAGFDRMYISLIERGINRPTIRTVEKLAGVLKVAPSKIRRLNP